MSMTFRRIKIAEWTSLTTLGLAGGLVAGILVGMPLGQVVNAMIVTAVVTCLVGAVLGSVQAISLRSLLPKPLWWILATIVGLGIGLAAGVAAVEQVGILMTGERPHLVQLSAPMRALSFVWPSRAAAESGSIVRAIFHSSSARRRKPSRSSSAARARCGAASVWRSGGRGGSGATTRGASGATTRGASGATVRGASVVAHALSANASPTRARRGALTEDPPGGRR